MLPAETKSSVQSIYSIFFNSNTLHLWQDCMQYFVCWLTEWAETLVSWARHQSNAPACAGCQRSEALLQVDALFYVYHLKVLRTFFHLFHELSLIIFSLLLRNDVADVMRQLNASGMQRRYPGQKKIYRRNYHSCGPNDTWHIDGTPCMLLLKLCTKCTILQLQYTLEIRFIFSQVMTKWNSLGCGYISALMGK